METSPLAGPLNRLREERLRRKWRQRDVAEQLGATILTVRRWENGTQQPHAYFRLKLCALFGKSAEALGLLPTSPLPPPAPERDTSAAGQARSSETGGLALWTVPFARNRYFTGRDDLLDQLDQHLSPEGSGDQTTTRRVALTQSQAIKGLGGIGKTQIALEYAYRSRERGHYTHILWIDAANEETLMASFGALGTVLPDFSTTPETDQHKLVVAIKRWLEACPQRWLLIFDNVEDLPLVLPFCPGQGNGSLLFTTRLYAVGALASSVEVETMGLLEGTSFLLQRAQRQDVSDGERNEAINVVITLDGFPLALDQAGAYIEETGCGFLDYLLLYRDHRRALLARRGTQATNYPDSVATTWSLSFQKVAHINPAAADLLQLSAFLAPDHIPEELLTENAEQWPALLGQAVTNRFTFQRLLEDVLRFSLMKRLTDQRMVSIHRLVQAVQMDALNPEEQRQWAERVVRAVHCSFPESENLATWSQSQRFLPHAAVCATWIAQGKITSPDAARLLCKAGAYFMHWGVYDRAEELFGKAFALWQCLPDTAPLDLADCLNYRGEVAHYQGKYAQAEALYLQAQRTLEPIIDTVPPKKQSMLLNNLASIYQYQGKYAQAEPLFHASLALLEQTVGPMDPDISMPLNNLARLLVAQKNYAQAEPLYLRALALREQHLGASHPKVAMNLNNLANLYVHQGKQEEAERFFLRALAIYEQAWGREHPSTAGCLYNLGMLRKQQKRYEQAQEFLEQALVMREQALGVNHPYVVQSVKELAHCYLEQGQYTKAEPLLVRMIAFQEQLLGLEHLEVARALNSLADLYTEQRKYEQAEPLYQRALRIREQSLGLAHPEVGNTLSTLAKLYVSQSKYEHAESFYQRALAICEQVFGPHHVTTAETRTCLIALLHTLGQEEEAAQLEVIQAAP